MHTDIRKYNATQPIASRGICTALADLIDSGLKGAASKLWHRSPVWFIDGNPVAGYAVRKGYVQLLFWSGQSFDEPALQAEGKFKAADLRFTHAAQIRKRELKRWLRKAQTIQWDYKNIVKRRGVLEKIGTW